MINFDSTITKSELEELVKLFLLENRDFIKWKENLEYQEFIYSEVYYD